MMNKQPGILIPDGTTLNSILKNKYSSNNKIFFDDLLKRSKISILDLEVAFNGYRSFKYQSNNSPPNEYYDGYIVPLLNKFSEQGKLNEVEKNKKSALGLAIGFYGGQQEGIVESLLNKGADPLCKDGEGNIPLALALAQAEARNSYKGDPDDKAHAEKIYSLLYKNVHDKIITAIEKNDPELQKTLESMKEALGSNDKYYDIIKSGALKAAEKKNLAAYNLLTKPKYGLNKEDKLKAANILSGSNKEDLSEIGKIDPFAFRKKVSYRLFNNVFPNTNHPLYEIYPIGSVIILVAAVVLPLVRIPTRLFTIAKERYKSYKEKQKPSVKKTLKPRTVKKSSTPVNTVKSPNRKVSDDLKKKKETPGIN